MTGTTHFLTAARQPETGKLDALRMAEVFGLTQKEMAQALGRDPAGLKRHPASANLQVSLSDFEALGVHLREVFGNIETGRMWLRAPNPMLSGKPPVTYMLQGQPAVIERLLVIAETGMPT